MKMTHERLEQDPNPLLFVTINNEARSDLLCRTLARIWAKPVFLIRPTVRETVSYFIEKSLQGERLCPDLILIDMESGEKNAGSIIETIRSISGIRNTPLIAMMDGDSSELKNQTYDAGADLVIFWDNLESRIGDIATLVIDNWLSTEDEAPDQKHARSGA